MKNTENAKRGIAKVYSAEILQLVGAVLNVFLVIGAIVTLGAAAVESSEVVGASFGITALLAIVSLILSLISFIMQISGLNIASGDSGEFKKAIYWIITAIILSLLSGLFSEGIVSTVVNSVLSLVNVGITYHVVRGVNELLPNSALADKGNRILKLITVVIIIETVCRFLGGFQLVKSVAEIIAVVCTIIYYFLYLSFLSHAKREL